MTEPLSNSRVGGLDTIRFLCAILVVFGHGMKPGLTDGLSKNHFIGMATRGIYNNLWSGPAAVIVFFVISGFCIHFAYVDIAKSVNLKLFYSRRMIRVAVPAFVAVLLSQYCGIVLSDLDHSVLWSLVAEIVYYAIYPVLLSIRRRCRSWLPLILFAYAAAFCVVATKPESGDYPSFGLQLNWILGLPCWLLGCLLAERVFNTQAAITEADAVTHVSSSVFSLQSSVWVARFAVLGAGWLCSVLRFHSPLGYPWTLNVFAILVLGWLQVELTWRKTQPAPALLENAGVWSYSLYLTHPAAMALAEQVRWSGGFADVRQHVLFVVGFWFAKLLFILLFAYVFYWLVERPSHYLARWLSLARTTLVSVNA